MGERGRGGRGRERNIDLLFHLFMHSFVDSCVCPYQDRTPILSISGCILINRAIWPGPRLDFLCNSNVSASWTLTLEKCPLYMQLIALYRKIKVNTGTLLL